MARASRHIAVAATATLRIAAAAAPAAAAAATPWVPCPVFTYTNVSWNPTAAEFDSGSPVGANFSDEFASECALAPAPLDYSRPELASIGLFVKRLSPRGAAPRHAVWLLSGGPGDAAADDVEPLHALLAERLPRGDFEIYTVDHRGTAESSRLGCALAQAERPGSPGGVAIDDVEWPRCLASLAAEHPGGASRHFSVSNAARDLHLLMERFRAPGQSVSVYGISYGTGWAGRYARMFPSHARAIVLDGVLSGSGSASRHERLTFERWDEKMHGVGLKVLDEKCGKDSFCASKLGPVPSATVSALFEKLEGGAHCAESLGALGGLNGLKKKLGGLLYGWAGRAAMTALLYRLQRCAADDVAALAHFAAAEEAVARVSSCCGPQPRYTTAPPLRSDVLLRNIVLSEYWEQGTTEEQMRGWADRGWFSIRAFEAWLPLRPQWPLYDVDEFFNTTLRTASPVLLLNGDVDPQTPLWSAVREQSTAEGAGGATLLVWPGAVHSSAQNTPVEGGGDQCSLTAIAAFLIDPGDEASWKRPPCRDRLLGIDFRGTPALNEQLWGTPDAYEGDVVAREL